MPKPEPGSAKALSNAMKSRGLQKLKFYCEMCKKQCRDDNAFKCHSQSETHQRQMRLFAENHGHYINEYSKEFERSFLDLMKRRYFSKQIPANKVYVDMISNKNHIHMTSTKWTTLTGFVEYLGKSGKCLVEHTEKGPLVQFVDRGPEAVKRKMEKEKREREDKKSAIMENQAMKKFEDSLKKEGNETNEQSEKELVIEEEEKLENENLKGIEILLKNSAQTDVLKQKNPFETIKPITFGGFLNKNLNLSNKRTDKIDDFLMEIKGKKKVHSEEKPPMNNEETTWLLNGLIVKIKDKSLDCFSKKAIVVSIDESGFVGIVETLENKETVKIDQKFLETVIPKIGGKVKIVKKGENFGKIAVLQGINTNFYTATMLVENKILEYKYEEICKFVVES